MISLRDISVINMHNYHWPEEGRILILWDFTLPFTLQTVMCVSPVYEVGFSLQALSKLLCCLANCSMVSSRWWRCSLSCCRVFCHLRLWDSATSRKSRQAWGVNTTQHKSKDAGRALVKKERPVSRYTRVAGTHIDHSIGGDAEKGGSLINSFHSVCAVSGSTQILKFAEGALEGGTVLPYQLITGAQVI